MAQNLRPSADRLLGAWLGSAGGSPTELWPSLDETSPADVDYVYTETTSTFEVRLAAGSEPSVDTGHVLRVRVRGDGATPFTITLLDNSVSPPLTIATRSEISPIPGTSFLTYEFAVSASEAGAILSYSSLSVLFMAGSEEGAGGPVAFNNAESVSGTGVASLTTSSWAIAGSSRCLVAGICWGGAATYTAIKWEGSGGTSLTQQGTTHTQDTDHMAIATLASPNAVSGTLYGQISGNSDHMSVGGISFTGVHQTVPLGTQVRASANSDDSPATATASAVSGAAEDMFVSFALATPESGVSTVMTIAVGAGQAMRWEEENYGPSWVAASTMSTEPGGTSATLTEVISCTGDTIDWLIIGVAVKSA